MSNDIEKRLAQALKDIEALQRENQQLRLQLSTYTDTDQGHQQDESHVVSTSRHIN